MPPAAQPALALLPEGQRQAPPAPGTPAAFVMPALTEATLANGMKLVTARTGTVPLATLTVAIRAGSAVEGRPGMLSMGN